MNNRIIGTCTQMCPEDEIILREQEHLLHVLEMIPGTEGLSHPKVDRTRVIKSYSRSAAGQAMQSTKNLRTADTLLKTVNYLLTDVISDKNLRWHKIYDFILDRLLAVRQDMVIQRLETPHYISILQPIVRFHAFAAYRLCESPQSEFDPVINNKHLQECLNKLLILYDDCDRVSKSCLNLKCDININEYDALYEDSRPYIEALYILFNLENTNVIMRALTLPVKWRTTIVKKCLAISLSITKGNWVRAFRLFLELPTLLAATASLHLPTIRRKALQTMAVAYSSKNLSVPLEDVKKWLLYSTDLDIINDCKHYNITYNQKSNTIHFLKSEFNHNKKLTDPRYEKFVLDNFSEQSVPSMVLYGEMS